MKAGGINMAESNITKKALSTSMKKLMMEKPFSKIRISDICDDCGMNRKSFYYHFMDKYDLVNWIFDTEFIEVNLRQKDQPVWSLLEPLCHYLDSERQFYCSALEISGQNSFSEHFTEMMLPLLEADMHRIMGEATNDFYVNFIADALILAIKRWIMEMPNVSADEFISMIRVVVVKTAESVVEKINE